MPHYSYHCVNCFYEKEIFQSIKAEPLQICPHCASFSFHRKIGVGSALIFQGNGFYETDYKKKE